MTAALAVMGLVLSAGPQAMAVPITVVEPAGIARVGEPVSGGVPLVPGAFKPGAVDLALFDGATPVPVQISELVVGPKGDVRWVLLDWQMDLKPGETRTLTLRPGAKVLPANPLKVDDTAEAVRIDTGKIAFAVSKTKPFGLVEDVTAGGRPVVTGGAVSYTNGLDGQRYLAAAPDTVKVHYAGPFRVTVEVRGRFTGDVESKVRFATYLTAWANRSDLLVKHLLINSREDMQYFVKIKGSEIELRPATAAPTVGVGAGALQPLDRRGQAVALHQGLPETAAAPCRVTVGDQTTWSGKGAGGWLVSGPVWVQDRLFAVDPPRRLSVAADGAIVLDAAPVQFPPEARPGQRPNYSQDDYRWLFDCTQHSSEYRINFAASSDPAMLATQAKAANARLWGVAAAKWISDCRVLGSGRFGTLEDEKACHALWKWPVEPRTPTWAVNPTRFVGWEDNHYESEADSTEAMLLMFLRTGQRGYLDEAEGWARYHTDVQAWRTEGWPWKDGGIWWPQGGPPGNRPVRGKGNRAQAAPSGSLGARTLAAVGIAKGCYCHYYGAGLVDWFCLTGDRDALDAAIDDCETKYNDYTRAHVLVPGKTGIPDHRGFGRGFYVAVRTWMVQPQNEMLTKLITLCGRTLAEMPPAYMDERGVVASAGGGTGLDRFLTPGIRKFMQDNGITVDEKKLIFKDREGKTWPWKYIGGTWEICYVQNAADLYAQETGDVDVMDYAVGAGEFAARYMLSPAAKQTWYITALDIPLKGDIWDDWKYDGKTRNADGEGPQHSGWYTCFFPDACARAYSWVGEPALLERAKEFWWYGNRRLYQSTKLLPNNRYAWHNPSKDDSVLSTARLFYEAAHPRQDGRPPTAVTDLRVTLLGDGQAEVAFTAPADQGGGKTAIYQVKAAPLPIVAYQDWDYARDDGVKRNWWRATNLQGEPEPKPAGQSERFVVTGVPAGDTLYFALRSFDGSSNRSAMSNLVEVKK
jgi:hypothetical protein